MDDLTHIDEWTQALEAKCWPYFFMRGVEAHFAGHPQETGGKKEKILPSIMATENVLELLPIIALFAWRFFQPTTTVLIGDGPN